MKRIFTSILLLFLSASVFAQDTIKNFSFENWTTDADTNEVPVDWDYNKRAVKEGVLKKHTSGSDGSTSLYLGKYFKTPGFVEGADVSIEGNLTSIPKYFVFDYIVYYEGLFSDLVVQVFFYDANDIEIDDYLRKVGNETSSFKRETIILDTNKIANAKSYKLLIYSAPNGGIADYNIVDNIRFSNYPGTAVGVRETAVSDVNLYPNPTNGIINYTVSNNDAISQVIVTSVSGKQIVFEPNFTNTIDISALASGIYSVSILNENDKVIGTQKVILTK
jgi:hypothetical protein